MLPLIGSALIGAGADLFGGLLGSKGQHDANVANARQAQLNRDFEERMSSTSYQRAVADMRAAGLNPALAYQQGGASSPSGSTAHLDNELASAGSGAREAATTFQTIANLKAQRGSIEAATDKTHAEAAQIRLESAARLQQIESQSLLNRSSATKINELLPFEQGLIEAQTGETGARALSHAYDTDLMSILRPYRVAAMLATINRDQASARGLNADALLRELAEPEARNRSVRQGDWFKRIISPYLNDAGSIVRLKPFLGGS